MAALWFLLGAGVVAVLWTVCSAPTRPLTIEKPVALQPPVPPITINLQINRITQVVALVQPAQPAFDPLPVARTVQGPLARKALEAYGRGQKALPS